MILQDIQILQLRLFNVLNVIYLLDLDLIFYLFIICVECDLYNFYLLMKLFDFMKVVVYLIDSVLGDVLCLLKEKILNKVLDDVGKIMGF